MTDGDEQPDGDPSRPQFELTPEQRERLAEAMRILAAQVGSVVVPGLSEVVAAAITRVVETMRPQMEAIAATLRDQERTPVGKTLDLRWAVEEAVSISESISVETSEPIDVPYWMVVLMASGVAGAIAMGLRVADPDERWLAGLMFLESFLIQLAFEVRRRPR